MAEGGEKTESATPRRRDDARKKGQVAKSTELAQTFVLMGLLFGLHSFGTGASRAVRTFFENTFRHLDVVQLDPTLVMREGAVMVLTLVRSVGPLAATAFFLGVFANVAQTGPMWAFEALRPDFNRLNPINGAKRFVSAQGIVQLVKSLYKIGLISYIAYITIRAGFPQLAMLSRMEIPQAVALIGDLVYHLAIRVTGTMLVLSAIDYGYQRYQHEKSLKMSKEEVKQEHKGSEGSPQLKARIRAKQREMSKKRMMEEVPTADVIITNPTHFAVALRYDPAKGSAPLVVAKGADLMAARIRELARENDVPIVENPPLARAIFKQVEIGREIPGELYEAVAEVLAFVYQINQRRRERAGFDRPAQRPQTNTPIR